MVVLVVEYRSRWVLAFVMVAEIVEAVRFGLAHFAAVAVLVAAFASFVVLVLVAASAYLFSYY